MHPHDLGIGSLFWSVPDAVVVGDVQRGDIVLWNPAAEQMFGYSSAEIVGQPIETLVPEAYQARHRAGLHRYRETGQGTIIDQRKPVEVTARTKWGAELNIELTLGAVDQEGGASDYVVAIIRDITERRQAQAREEALKAELALQHQKDAFLSMVAHAVRTPLTVIRGHTQLLQRQAGPGDDRTRAQLQTVVRQVHHLTALIDDLIELPRLGTGDLPFTPVPMNYVDIVREVVEDLSSLHARQLITLTAPPTVPMEGDPRLLRQVLVNLIDNAVTHGPPGTSVHLSVEIRGERVLTSVSDAGPPIPDEQRARIFEPFHRLETLSRQRSLGIGLAISKGVIEAHRGHIWVADEDHACFVFSLPYTHPENHEARPHKDEVGS